MKTEEAQKTFSQTLRVKCPNCEAEVGVLCDLNGLWVCYARLMLAERTIPTVDLKEATQLLEEALSIRMHGSGPHPDVDQDGWDSRCEEFLRKVK